MLRVRLSRGYCPRCRRFGVDLFAYWQNRWCAECIQRDLDHLSEARKTAQRVLFRPEKEAVC